VGRTAERCERHGEPGGVVQPGGCGDGGLRARVRFSLAAFFISPVAATLAPAETRHCTAALCGWA